MKHHHKTEIVIVLIVLVMAGSAAVFANGNGAAAAPPEVKYFNTPQGLAVATKSGENWQVTGAVSITSLDDATFNAFTNLGGVTVIIDQDIINQLTRQGGTAPQVSSATTPAENAFNTFLSQTGGTVNPAAQTARLTVAGGRPMKMDYAGRDSNGMAIYVRDGKYYAAQLGGTTATPLTSGTVTQPVIPPSGTGSTAFTGVTREINVDSTGKGTATYYKLNVDGETRLTESQYNELGLQPGLNYEVDNGKLTASTVEEDGTEKPQFELEFGTSSTGRYGTIENVAGDVAIKETNFDDTGQARTRITVAQDSRGGANSQLHTVQTEQLDAKGEVVSGERATWYQTKDGAKVPQRRVTIEGDGKGGRYEVEREYFKVKGDGTPEDHNDLAAFGEGLLQIVPGVGFTKVKFCDASGDCKTSVPGSITRSVFDYFDVGPMARGMGGYTSLFTNQEAFDQWAEGAEKLMGSAYLGSQYFVSKICDKKLGGHAGYSFVNGPDWKLGVTVNGEQQNATFVNESGLQTQYIYKLSYKVSIPKKTLGLADDKDYADDAGGKFYIQLKKSDGTNVNIYKGDTLKGVTATGSSMNVKYSGNVYNRICVKFDRAIEFNAHTVDIICNTIKGAGGASSPVSSQPGPAGGTGNVEEDW